MLLQNKSWVFFLVTSFLGGVGAFSVASYLYPYMAEVGATETQMGIASFIATLTEIPIFFFGHHLIKRFTSHSLFIAALAMMGVRSLLFAAAATPLTVFAIQAFGGMMFPAMWLAGVTYTDENAPDGLKSTAQGLFGAVSFGFGSAVGGFIGGVLLESIGGQSMFFVLGVLILVLLALFETTRRLVSARAISQIDTV